MATLLMRFAAPMQSWGDESKFQTRRTASEPTKSGVIGLVASALGRGREESIDDLRNMKFGVRVDQEGSLLRDFHTVNGDYAYVTTRYYLEDAIFVVGLESENEELLKQIDDALHHPTFIPFLGRRSCPPSAQIPMGILDAPLEDALRLVPWQMSLWRQRKTGIAYLRLVTDASPDEAGAADVNDVPLSYNPERRKYGWRKVVSREPVKVSPPEIHPAHNAFADL